MKNIQAVKQGNVINFSIDGKLQKKNCGSSTEADILFKAILKVKENYTDENFKQLKSLLNERLRIAYLAGLETDPETNEVFLAGFNTPIPTTLLDVIKEYHENNYPMDAIINFWKLLMINPDKRIRKSLFDFIITHDFVLTDAGYMIVYKTVNRKENKTTNVLGEFVTNQYLHVKKDWKCNPNKYAVYKNLEDDSLGITKFETVTDWTINKNKNVDVLGKLGELYDVFLNTPTNEDSIVYTDKYTGTMDIVLGKPVKMERKECDGDPAKDCSYGLNLGATRYVEKFVNFRGDNGIVLACYVNPAHIVAVPEADHSKFRTTEYFPFALATYENGKIDIIDQKYFENDYVEYEVLELEELVNKIKAEELPFADAKNAEKEERSMSELLKIVQERIIDINS